MGSADRSPTARPCQPATVFDFPRPLARGRAHALTEGKCWRFYALVDPLDQALSRPAPLLDARGDGGDLSIRVGPCIFGVWDQPIDPPPLDLVSRPRSLISRGLSRAGARTR